MSDTHWYFEIARQARLTTQQTWALLCHARGDSVEEIALCLEISEHAARAHLRRAQQRLRDNGPYLLRIQGSDEHETIYSRLRKEACELLVCLANALPSGKPPPERQYDAAGNIIGRPARAVTAEDVVEYHIEALYGAKIIIEGRPDPDKHAGGME